MAARRPGVAAFLKRAPSLRGAVVFAYHGMARFGAFRVPVGERKYWITRPQFVQQIGLITAGGYIVSPLPELWKHTLEAGDAKLRVGITFDDGRVSDYEIAYPALLEAGLRADFFINTANVGKEGFLAWWQIVEMQRAGMSFQSHGHDHVYLSWLGGRDLYRQLIHSKLVLEGKLGQAVEFLSAPYGDLNKRVTEAARRVGYRAVCNSRSWPARPGAATVNRLVVYSHTTDRGFRGLLAGSAACYAARAARETLLYLPKRALVRFRPSPPPREYRTLAEET